MTTEKELIERLLERSTKTTVMDGNGDVHSAVKAKVSDIQAVATALSAKDAQVEALKAELDRYTRLSEIGESLGGELEEREARIEAQAENKRLREVTPCGLCGVMIATHEHG